MINYYQIFVIASFLISGCKNSTTISSDSFTTTDTIVQVSQYKDNISSKDLKSTESKNASLYKLEAQQRHSVEDYEILVKSLSNNKDESYSENFGYLLFQYFIENPLYRKDFNDFLLVKSKSTRNKILISLIQVMCIDFQLENYTYGDVIRNFEFFVYDLIVEDTFKKCIDN